MLKYINAHSVKILSKSVMVELEICQKFVDLTRNDPHAKSFFLHINQLTRSCCYQLRQFRVVSRSLSCSAAAALVHAFVTSRLDHCSSILAGLPLAQTARLDRVLRYAARLIGRIPKYGSVSAYMRDTLHWLPFAQSISYRMAVLVWQCLLRSAPAYLYELCRPVSGLPGRRALRSSVIGLLMLKPHAKTETRQSRAFSIVGPSTWNGLPLEIRLLSKNSESAFCRLLTKIDLYRRGWVGAPLSRFLEGAPYRFF